MKKVNRSRIYVSKHIRGLSWDRFEMTVPTKDVDTVKKEYERRDYSVFMNLISK